jgi:DNA repair exonuclease SbcCD ATPase subunit
MRLEEITISAFRGFNKEENLKLNNNVVLVKGSNGSGKSSLAEALEWLFFDEISRKKKSSCKSEYTGDFLRNLHADEKQETFVAILADINGLKLKLKKKFLSPEKNEYYINDQTVADFSSLGINLSYVYKPILSQVETKHYVETDPKDRWEETNRLLGLGTLNELRADLQELLTSKKTQSQYENYKKVLYGIESDLKKYPELRALKDELLCHPFSLQNFKKELIGNMKKTCAPRATTIDNASKAIDRSEDWLKGVKILRLSSF